MKRLFVGAFCLALLGGCAVAQKPGVRLPCTPQEALLRDSQGHPILFSSDEMKARATHKEDIEPFFQQIDVKLTAIVRVIVDSRGRVACLESINMLQVIRPGVERALQVWHFKPKQLGGNRVAYVGDLEFTLCNTGCGAHGPSMTLLE